MNRAHAKGAAKEERRQWVLPTFQDRSRQKRDRLLKAGEEVFAEHGFADAHVSEIAEIAGCSIGSFYRRFKDKEALFLALQIDLVDRGRERIDQFFAHPACESAPLTDICCRLIENTSFEVAKTRGYYRALFEIGLRGMAVWDRMRELERYQAECLHRLFVRRGCTDLRRDFHVAVTAALRMIFGNIVSMVLFGPGPYKHDDRNSTSEFTRVLMTVAGVPADEDVLRRMRNRRRKRSE